MLTATLTACSVLGGPLSSCVPFDTAECFCLHQPNRALIGFITLCPDTGIPDCFQIQHAFGAVTDTEKVGMIFRPPFTVGFSTTTGSNVWLLIGTKDDEWWGGWELTADGGYNVPPSSIQGWPERCAAFPAQPATEVVALSVQSYDLCTRTLHDRMDLPVENCALPDEGCCAAGGTTALGALAGLGVSAAIRRRRRTPSSKLAAGGLRGIQGGRQ